ncbi:hypothetical protein E3N88_30761 [Mikania micrantha]|uniref:Uncharacterized protein n=1 Tax=Mikania micrantha TaxID=192012 RepID=A0A5N6MPS4_9ASTR|nr:hypothetical protein E3N88_30761 [Mikania micrantha]
MAPQTLFGKIILEAALSAENDRLIGHKGGSSTTMLQQSCHYQYVPQHPIVHLVAPQESSSVNCCKVTCCSVVVGSSTTFAAVLEMVPQKLLAEVLSMEAALSTEKERLAGQKGGSSSPMMQQSCHYQYVPQHPVHLVAPKESSSTANCCKATCCRSVVVGS